ncbi:MAG: type II toxin-antitoxin system HicB family antitoxin [Hydrococcus sp. Prado102]|jgi:predicted transcriptional regulator|nr:type II toxin-antitoxin system HicB family antitoxin [Hydrococcus sp. Prado102]
MELSVKTTILLSPELHRRLTSYAEQRGVSMGALVREACETLYGTEVDRTSRLDAVRALGALALPVGAVADMKRESVPATDDPVP